MISSKRWDHNLIFGLVEPGSSVLDLGCGNGELLARLIEKKQVRGQAVEADHDQVSAAFQNGVDVYQGDLNRGLPEFRTKSFDYVILEKTLQVLSRPMLVLEEMLRIGDACFVSFPNFHYSGVVEKLLETERMPVTEALPYYWYDTPNIHLFTLYDFIDWIEDHQVEIIDGYAAAGETWRHLKLPEDSKSAEELLFLLRKE